MSRMSLFNSPLLLGFEHFERTIDRANRTASDGYPPYNIEKTSDDALRITLAVAGFSRDDLSIVLEDRQLVVRGRQAKEDNRDYIHRGIAARQFQRAFVLADGIEVVGAEMSNGLLHVDVVRPQTASVARKIEIRSTTDSEALSADRAISMDVEDGSGSAGSATE